MLLYFFGDYMKEYFMTEALKEAKKAFDKNEIPVGCVIVCDNKIIARAHNLRENKKNALYHAEIIAINKACKKLKSWRLDDCDMYVTLEPCSMCSGAIIQSKIKNIYFGASDLKTGAAGGKLDLFSFKFNYDPNVEGAILEEECSKIIKDFFVKLREK